MSLAATLTTDDTLGTVTITATGGTEPYSAQATPVGVPTYTVRSRWVDGVAIDADLPLGVDTEYVVTDATGAQVIPDPVQVNPTGAVLTDDTDPTRGVPVNIISQLPNTWDARSVWWDVLGREDPMVTIAPMRYRAGDVVLYVDRADRTDLFDLLLPGRPLNLRTPCSDALDDVHMLVQRVTEDFANPESRRGNRTWRLSYQAVTRDLGAYSTDASRTYGSLLEEAATYGDLTVSYATYADLLTGDPIVLGPELVSNGDFASGATDWTVWSYSGAHVTLDASSGYAELTAPGAAAGGEVGYLVQPALVDFAVVAGTKYRIKVRCRTAAGSGTVGHALVLILSTKVSGAITPSSAGTVQYLVVNAAVGDPFVSAVFDVEVPAGHATAALWMYPAGTIGDVAGTPVQSFWVDDVSLRVINP